MRYNIYLDQIEKAHTKRKLVKLLDLIGSDFTGINFRQYEELKFLILGINRISQKRRKNNV